jgi:hypothetical protein
MMRRPLVFERERSALLNAIIEEAFEEALKRGMFLGIHGQEARMILVRRVIRAIEKGESNLDKLRSLALKPDTWPDMSVSRQHYSHPNRSRKVA